MQPYIANRHPSADLARAAPYCVLSANRLDKQRAVSARQAVATAAALQAQLQSQTAQKAAAVARVRVSCVESAALPRFLVDTGLSGGPDVLMVILPVLAERPLARRQRDLRRQRAQAAAAGLCAVVYRPQRGRQEHRGLLLGARIVPSGGLHSAAGRRQRQV